MAVQVVQEIWHGRTGSEDEKAVRTYVRVFRAITDSPLTGQAEVGADTRLPRRFDPYQDASGFTDATALAEAIQVNQTDDPFTWEVVCTFSNRCDQPELGAADPLGRPTEIEIEFAQFQTIADADINGNPVLNSAWEKFDPPPMMDDSRPVIVMTRNEASFDYAILADYQNCVNSKPWLGYPAHTVKLNSIKAKRHYENNVYYWQVTYEFHVKNDLAIGGQPVGWRLAVLDQGYYQLDANGNRELITDKFGQPLTSPALLDGFGHQLAYSPVAQKFNSIFLYWDIYEAVDFTPLNLP